MDLRSAVGQAVRAGAYTTTHLGVIDGLPTRAELEAFSGLNDNAFLNDYALSGWPRELQGIGNRG